MGKVIIQEETTKNPITLMGKESGCCYGSDISNDSKNYKRGLNCLKANHGRVMEFPQVYLIIDGYSAKVIRELYTHIGGAPTRLQSSTRYIDYKDFDFVVPHTISADKVALDRYYKLMNNIMDTYEMLTLARGIPAEDAANVLPLAMTTKIVLRTNLRNLIDMSHQRLCARAYWEYRELMRDIISALKEYSDEWKYLVEHEYFCPKCDMLGYCPESRCCGRTQKRKEN